MSPTTTFPKTGGWIFPAVAIVHVLNLPFPPSTNAIWRSIRRRGVEKPTVIKSQEYRKWLIAADTAIMADGGMRGRATIDGPFTALIDLDISGSTGDLDNRIKPLLDYAQRLQFVKNDGDCLSVTARWATGLPRGCRLTLEQVL